MLLLSPWPSKLAMKCAKFDRYPDEEAGEVPMAFVVRNPKGNIIDERQVIDFIARQVAPYKKIRRVSFVSTIPRSAAGKILRKELKKMVIPNSKM